VLAWGALNGELPKDNVSTAVALLAQDIRRERGE
jgi:hypothetical protein